MESEAKCTHITVKYDPVPADKGTRRSSWKCSACGQRFALAVVHPTEIRAGFQIEDEAALATPPVPTDTVRLAPWYEQREEQHKSHLVRGKKTLCGLDEWGGGNVDFKFGVEQGITSCVRCLRVLALEGLKAKTQPDAAVEAALDVFEAQAYNRKDVVRFAEKIVAAVRAADAEKAGAK